MRVVKDVWMACVCMWVCVCLQDVKIMFLFIDYILCVCFLFFSELYVQSKSCKIKISSRWYIDSELYVEHFIIVDNQLLTIHAATL